MTKDTSNNLELNNLGWVIFKNIGYNGIARAVSLICQALANIILSRTLLSSDYGIVGFAWIFVNFLSQFNDLGINSAVIQKNDLDEKGLYTGFTIKTALGLLLFAISFICSGLGKFLFDNPAVIRVIQAISVNFIINSFAFLPSSLLKRDLDYKKVSIANMTSTIANSGLAAILALTGFGYWSIVLGNLFSTIMLIVCLNVLRPVKIKFRFDRKKAEQLIHYGGNLFLTGLMVFALFNLDSFLIGTILGSSLLGFYMIAMNWGSVICDVLGSTINTVLFPAFSRIQKDRERMKRSYLKTLEYVCFLGLLANMTLFAIAPEFLSYVLGKGTAKWLPALPSLQILCVYGIFRFILEPVGSVIMAVGKTKVLLKANCIAGIIQALFLYPALKYFSLEGAAIIVTVSYISQYFVYIPYLKEEFDLKLDEIFDSVRPAILSGLIVGMIVLLSQVYLEARSITSLIIKLFLTSTGFCFIYGMITRWKMLKETKSLITSSKQQEYMT